MRPWWLLCLAVGFFALAAVACLLASRHLRPGWLDNPRGLPRWSRRGRPMWDDFEPAGRRWLLVQWGCLLAFGLCLLGFAVAAGSP
jgi:hypothetical protein